MADIAAGIVSRLAAVSGVTDVIGDRVFPAYVREADRAYPLAVYDLKITPVPTFSGDAGVRYATLRIAAIGVTYGSTVIAADAIESALSEQSGTWGNVLVQGCFLQPDGISDDVVTDPSTEQILQYVRTLTFDVVFDT